MGNIYMIAACAKNGVIGNQGAIPWDIPGEQKRFKDLTMNNIVIMGRRTYEEIGKPLPGRIMIILSSTKKFDGCYQAESISEALVLAGEIAEEKDIFICGGAELYKLCMPYAKKLFITEINLEVEGDTYFPDFDKSRFIKTVEKETDQYNYVTYVKKADEAESEE